MSAVPFSPVPGPATGHYGARRAAVDVPEPEAPEPIGSAGPVELIDLTATSVEVEPAPRIDRTAVADYLARLPVVERQRLVHLGRELVDGGRGVDELGRAAPSSLYDGLIVAAAMDVLRISCEARGDLATWLATEPDLL